MNSIWERLRNLSAATKRSDLRFISLRILFPLSMGVVLLPLVAMMVGAYLSVLQVAGHLDENAREISRELLPVQEIQNLLSACDVMLIAFANGQSDARNPFLRAQTEVEAAFQNLFAQQAADQPRERQLLRNAFEEWKQSRAAASVILAVPDAHMRSSVARELNRFETHLMKSIDLLNKCQDVAFRELRDNLKQGQATEHKVLILLAAGSVLCLGLAIAAGFGLGRFVLVPLGVLTQGVERFGTGDFSHRIILKRGDELGQLARTFNTMTENIERFQESLRQSEDRYRDIVENSQDLICTHDLDGRILTVSGGGVRLMGYTPEDLLGHNIAEFVAPDSPDQFVDYLARLKRDAHASGQWKVQSARGKTVVLEYNMSIRREGVATPIARGMARDVTERMRAEAQILLQAAALESAANAIVIADRDGRITWVNPSFTRLTGFTAEEAIGQNPRILKSGHHDSAFYQQMWQTLMSGKNWRGEIINKRKDGALYNEEMTITPVYSDGKIHHFVAIKQDITERIRTQEELASAREAAEAANRAKSDFLARMSHEIRTPMNGVIGMTELALDTELDPEQREFLETVKKSADTLLAVINDILDFSKIEAHKLELDAIPFRLRDTLDDMLATLAVRAQQKEIELVCDVSANVPDVLVGDPGRLRQILINLVGNAIKFTQTGEIVVRISVESEKESAAQLLFSVRDTGVGIPPEKLSTIFQPFEQADGTITRRYGGTGLGLAIATQLAELMGGALSVESKPGEGSTFSFSANFAIGALAAVPAPVILHSLSALVVDDNETNRRILEKVLGSWGMNVTTADRGGAALTAIQWAANARKPFCLALIDAQMPMMDGFALIGELRKDSTTSSLPVIMMTSAGLPGDSARCRELGVAAYLTKPVRQSQLLETILAALGATGAQTGSQPLITRHSLREHKRSLRILLAEDNLINQTVAQRVLEKWGHSVCTVQNGKEALDALETQVFDMVLMDVEMPEMDGLQATAALRARELDTRQHVPIVAMTAHAMKGDKERCLAAGMDAYVSKPVQVKELCDVMEKLMSLRELVADEGRTSRPVIYETAFDRAHALEYVGDSERLLFEIAAIFLEHTPKVLAEIHTAIVTRDPNTLERAAHTLQGSLSVFGAEVASAAAQELESLGRAGGVDGAEAICAALDTEVARLSTVLAEMTAANPVPEPAETRR
jgi:two-component system sensor histidine kinase/response regulator